MLEESVISIEDATAREVLHKITSGEGLHQETLSAIEELYGSHGL